MLLQAMLSRDNLNARLKVIYSKSLKVNQLQAINKLFNEKKDVIFIAKTGYRKCVIFYSVLALKSDTMTLMIMLLLALKKDQKLAIKKMQINSNLYILNDKTMIKRLLDKIQSGIFIHVLILPKIAISNKDF